MKSQQTRTWKRNRQYLAFKHLNYFWIIKKWIKMIISFTAIIIIIIYLFLFLYFNKLSHKMKRGNRWSHLYSWLDELTRCFGPQIYISNAPFALRGLCFCSSNLADSILGSYFTCIVYKGSQIFCGKIVFFSPFPVNWLLMSLSQVSFSQPLEYSQDGRQFTSYDTLVGVPVISGTNQARIAELSLTKYTEALRGFDGASKEVKHKWIQLALTLTLTLP